MAKVKTQRVVTPKVEFRYPRIDRPDHVYGNYKVQGIFRDKADLDAFVADIEPIIAASAGAGDGKKTWDKTTRKNGDKRLRIGDTNTPIYKGEDGQIFLDVAGKKPPRVYDTTGKMYPEDAVPPIGSGSTGKVQLGCFYSDVKGQNLSSYFNGLIIIGYKPYGGMSNQSDQLEDGEDAAPAAGEFDPVRADPNSAVKHSEDPSIPDEDGDDDEDEWC